MVHKRRVMVARRGPGLPCPGRSTRCRRGGPGTVAGGSAGTSWRTDAGPARTLRGSDRCNRPRTGPAVRLRTAHRVAKCAGGEKSRNAPIADFAWLVIVLDRPRVECRAPSYEIG